MRDGRQDVRGRGPASGSSSAATFPSRVTSVRPGGTPRRGDASTMRNGTGWVDINERTPPVVLVAPFILQLCVLPYGVWVAVAVVPVVLVLMVAAALTGPQRIRPPLRALARWVSSFAWLPGAYLAHRIDAVAARDNVLITVAQGIVLFSAGLLAIHVLINVI